MVGCRVRRASYAHMKNAALLALLLLAGPALGQPAGTLERIKANGHITLCGLPSVR